MKSAPVWSANRRPSCQARHGRVVLLAWIILLCAFLSRAQDEMADANIIRPLPIKISLISFNQVVDTVPVPASTDARRQWLVGGVSTVGYGGMLLVLNKAWYEHEARSKFHVFDDSREWLQTDKLGHAWTAYNTGRATTALWRWAGVRGDKAVWIGGLSGFAFLTGIEFLDAYSSKWGWSWSDIAANIAGSGIFMSQELAWHEQRIQYKFSFHGNSYHDPQLKDRANDLFGSTWYERMLKDYNAQTYWFSANLRSFFPASTLPRWLNVAVGYGATGMYGGFDNVWTNSQGNEITRRDIKRRRQFYLAPDIDFTRIPTSSKLLKTLLSALNAFKCPAPAIMLDGKGKMRVYALYF